MACPDRCSRTFRFEEESLKSLAFVSFLLGLVVTEQRSGEFKVDLSKEQVGKPPTTFQPIVGTWVIAQDGPDKVVMVDGKPWVASKDNPTRLLIETARKLYGTSNEE